MDLEERDGFPVQRKSGSRQVQFEQDRAEVDQDCSNTGWVLQSAMQDRGDVSSKAFSSIPNSPNPVKKPTDYPKK